MPKKYYTGETNEPKTTFNSTNTSAVSMPSLILIDTLFTSVPDKPYI